MRQIGPAVWRVAFRGAPGDRHDRPPCWHWRRCTSGGSDRSPSWTAPGAHARSPHAAPSKNYPYSANVQVAIDAETRLVIAGVIASSGARCGSGTAPRPSRRR
jgi:hypothetical protein